MNDLNIYRKEIDKIDFMIIKFLHKRFEVVKKVGKYKKINNIIPLQTGRWIEVLDTKKKIAKKYGLDEVFIENIWNEIHKYALTLEK